MTTKLTRLVRYSPVRVEELSRQSAGAGPAFGVGLYVPFRFTFLIAYWLRRARIFPLRSEVRPGQTDMIRAMSGSTAPPAPLIAAL